MDVKLQELTAAVQKTLQIIFWFFGVHFSLLGQDPPTRFASEKGSVGDPWHFGADPDSRIHTSD